jgi:hypothetical protein
MRIFIIKVGTKFLSRVETREDGIEKAAIFADYEKAIYAAEKAHNMFGKQCQIMPFDMGGIEKVGFAD